MRLKRCKNGHFYDAERYPCCPHCAQTIGKEACRDDEDLRSTIPARFVKKGVVSFLGSGATSKVYKICGESSYALKVIECGHNAATFQNAIYERNLMQHLKGHPHLIQLCDFDCMSDATGKTVYLLTEYQTTLTEYLAGKTISVCDAFALILGVCDALLECKKAGVLHLDIQPKNLYLDGSNTVMLGDFGASLLENDAVSNRTMRGTLTYMAPEVYRDGLCSERSEIYSVGLILYCLFHQWTLPFMDRTDVELAVYKRLAGTVFPSMTFPQSKLGDEIERCIQEACAFQPEDRFPTLEALRERLVKLQKSAQDSGAGSNTLFAEPIIGDSPVSKPLLHDWWRDGATTHGCAPAGQMFDADSIATSVALPVGHAAWEETANAYDHFPAQGTILHCGSDTMDAAWFETAAMDATPFSSTQPVHKNEPCMQGPDGEHGGTGTRCRVCDNPLPFSVHFCPYCGSKLCIEKPDVDLKRVQFSAVAPKSFLKGEYTIIHVVMYENAYRQVVDQLLEEAESPSKATSSGMLKVREGAKIRVTLSSPDIEIEDGEEVGQWQGEYLNFSFVVSLPEWYGKRQVLFLANVFVNDVIATRLKFSVRCASYLEQKISVTREDVLSAFVSYASQDRNRVASIIQGMKKARPDMDVFFDVESLRSGEDWESALRSEIANRDILFLCWSHFAQQSHWVDAEWRYALARKGIECIEPIPLEPPDLCPPPEELKRKHFNDKLLYIINAAEENRAPHYDVTSDIQSWE